jgi:hypothetical protein
VIAPTVANAEPQVLTVSQMDSVTAAGVPDRFGAAGVSRRASLILMSTVRLTNACVFCPKGAGNVFGISTATGAAQSGLTRIVGTTHAIGATHFVDANHGGPIAMTTGATLAIGTAPGGF